MDDNFLHFDDLYNEVRESRPPENQNFLELESIEERYEQISLIGSGGTKSVKLAYDKYACREIAMAVLANESGENTYDAFLHEARLTAQLDHPNIIKVHDIGISNAQPFFTMDLKTGQSIREMIQDTSKGSEDISLNEKLTVFLKVCDAISYAHSKGIIHLDIKPDNIQVGSFGEVIVCDWGLSTTIKTIDLEQINDNAFVQNLLITKPLSLHCAGTPGFMAPEQYSIDKEKNEQTDIYGLGALLYSLLTLTPPLSGSIEAIRRAAEKGQIPSPQSLGVKLPEALDEVILKAMALNPEDRYESAETIANDIRLYMNGFTCSAEKSGFIKETGRLLKRNRRVSSVAFISMAILVIFTSLFIISLNSSKREAVNARGETETVNKKLEVSLKETEVVNEKLAGSLREAELAKQKAEDSLALYLQEKSAFDDLAKDGLDKKIWLAHENIYDDPIPNTEFIIRLLSLKKDSKYKEKLAQAYIISGNFPKAHEIYKSTNIKHSEQALAEKFSSNKYRPPLSNKAFKEVLKASKTYNGGLDIIYKMVIYDRVQRKDFSDYGEILKLTLQCFWREWNGQLIYDAKKGYLKISGDKISSLLYSKKMNISLFKHLNIEEVDLSNTEFHFIGELGKLPNLKRLDISHTRVIYMPDFKTNFLPLEELTVKGIANKRLRSIPKRIKVIK